MQGLTSLTMPPLPAKMRAVEVLAPGGAEALCITDVAVPTLSKGEVLIQVSAAGVNRPDLLQRQGLYPPPAGASPRLGLEVSGRIVSLGLGVSEAHLGRKVMALTNGGGYAQYVSVPVAQCMLIPEGLSDEVAASLPETYLTVWQNLFVKAGLQKGQHVLIHGGSSGIGCAAIQLAKVHGAVVHVTVADATKAEFCRGLGADFVYLYPSERWEDLAYKNTGSQGIDVVLDMVAGDYVNRNLRCLKPKGIVIVIALLGGRMAQVDGALLMGKQALLTGSTLRPQSADFKASLCRAVEVELASGFAKGMIHSVVKACYEFDEVAQAHRWLESGKNFGKVVLRVSHNE